MAWVVGRAGWEPRDLGHPKGGRGSHSSASSILHQGLHPLTNRHTCTYSQGYPLIHLPRPCPSSPRTPSSLRPPQPHPFLFPAPASRRVVCSLPTLLHCAAPCQTTPPQPPIQLPLPTPAPTSHAGPSHPIPPAPTSAPAAAARARACRAREGTEGPAGREAAGKKG